MIQYIVTLKSYKQHFLETLHYTKQTRIIPRIGLQLQKTHMSRVRRKFTLKYLSKQAESCDYESM